jgi:hypothetical protein
MAQVTDLVQGRLDYKKKELVCLTLAVVAINSWNGFNVSFRTVPGDYQPEHR